ncbi:MAG: tRNA 4-thiouridine(8) synthase ThiI, partial [Candidatus Cloacimonadota bacterium]
AHKIDTFETSILPYDDCCTLFLPPNPNTKAKKKYLEIEEKKVNIEEIVKKAVDTVEIIDL